MFAYFSPILIAFFSSLLLGPFCIRFLKKINSLQSFRELGPKSHISKKSGTPTMGAWIFLLPIFGALLWYWYLFQSTLIFLVLFSMLIGALLGGIDDGLKILKSNYKGLNSIQKLILQFLTSSIIVYISGRYEFAGLDFASSNPLWFCFEFIWAFCVIAGTSNAINLTDGLDGLATSQSIIAFAGLAVLYHYREDLSSFLIALVIISCLAAFLVYNWKPAKIFMGDTGSLALGMGLGSLAYLTNLEYYLLIFALVPILETLSVILQVLSAKFSRKFLGKDIRIFKMAPLHHHFELCGLAETKVVILFALFQLLVSCSFLLFSRLN